MRCFLIVIAVCIFSSACFAEKARRGLYFDQAFGGEMNPDGAQLTSRIFYREPLFNSDRVLFQSSKIDVGLDHRLTPSTESIFAFFSVEPIAVFNFTMRAGHVEIYKLLGYGFISYSSYDDDCRDSERSHIPQRDRGGLWVDAASTLKGAVGPIAFMHTFTVNYMDFGSRGYFYEPYEDCIMKRTDHSFFNDSYLVYMFTPDRVLGMNHFLMNVPGSGYTVETVTVTGSWTTHYSDRLDLNASGKIGTHLQSRYRKYAFFIAAQCGCTYMLR